jgi:GT2 family glycosyltransferase
MSGPPGRVSAVVPTLGVSPWLVAALDALRGEDGPGGTEEAGGLEIVVVWQGPEPPPREVAERADRLLTYPAPLGFAAAVNRGIEAASGELVAVVNDDAVVGPGWIEALAAALMAEPRAAAAQGINYLTGHPTQPLAADAPADPVRIDGAGLTWNRWWQAVQIGHGERAQSLGETTALHDSVHLTQPPEIHAQPEGDPGPGPAHEEGVLSGPREVFGVSATAALYRRAALDEAAAGRAGERRGRRPERGAGRPGGPFDERLGSYYEDVELACRLRAAGWTALVVPAATVRHAGSATADRLGGRTRLVTGNRWLVAAWLLGRHFPLAKPRMAARDLADLARALGRGDLATAGGIAAGWGRALLLLPRWARLGPPAVDRATLRRLAAQRCARLEISEGALPDAAGTGDGRPSLRRGL